MQSASEYQGEGTTISYRPEIPIYTNVFLDDEPWVNPLSDNPRKQYSKKDKIKKKDEKKDAT